MLAALGDGDRKVPHRDVVHVDPRDDRRGAIEDDALRLPGLDARGAELPDDVGEDARLNATTVPIVRGGPGSRAPPQAIELAALPLAGPPLPADDRDRRVGLLHHGRAVVHVAGSGNGGSDARFDRPHDLHDAPAVGDERLDAVARANLGGRLCRQSLDLDVAGLAQLGRERAGLHEPHCAQPAIDSGLVGSEGISHAVKDGTARGWPGRAV